MGIVSVGLARWLEGNPSAYHLFKWRKRISKVTLNRQILSVMLIALLIFFYSKSLIAFRSSCFGALSNRLVIRPT